jgi:Ca-activated chloride channel family protein
MNPMNPMNPCRYLLLALVMLVPATVFGDTGVLLPRDHEEPDSSILSLREMEISVRIEGGDARVFIRQVFENHSGRIEEGTYSFALPDHATISDFAVWDGPVRIPAVILERRRAEELYQSLKQQSIDPGLLESERGSDEARKNSDFTAKITPIPAYGTKRMEIEYHERIPVENLKSHFAIPLSPDAYAAQVADHLWIHFELHSAHPISGFQVGGKLFRLKMAEKGPNLFKGDVELKNVSLTEDFSVQYKLDAAAADTLHVLTYRNPDSGQPSPDEMSPTRSHNEPGFLQAEALLGSPKSQTAKTGKRDNGSPRTIIVLFDNSLSMQWEKLERSYAAMEGLLHMLRPSDQFNLLLFNSKIQPYQPTPVTADKAAVRNAFAFVRASRLRGGTDLQQALDAGLSQCQKGNVKNAYLVLLSDGEATRGPIQSGKLAAWYTQRWKAISEAQRPRTFIFAVGDDANLELMKMLARNDGVLENVESTEEIDFPLESFLSKIGRSPIGQLGLNVSPEDQIEMVYPLQESAFSGSIASWVGQYKKAAENVSFDVHGQRDGEPLDIHAQASLPEKDLSHPQLPRLWASARVDALLEKIERDGEDQATIDEIIRLSRKYKFVTPYTSFLAAPRSLLRPRVIRPGDPVLRVRTDESIVSVVALFPFGLTQPLRHLAKEDIWQTRFLAPDDMRDGTYNVRLILRDRSGNTYRESKSFVIASTPPVVKILLAQNKYHRGETVNLKVSASQTTRSLVARLSETEAGPARLRWNRQAGASTGELVVPENAAAGTYQIVVTAEDIAHNIATQEVQIEVLP